jgi:hypothetical protein
MISLVYVVPASNFLLNETFLLEKLWFKCHLKQGPYLTDTDKTENAVDKVARILGPILELGCGATSFESSELVEVTIVSLRGGRGM